MTDTERAALFATIAAYLRVTDRRAALVAAPQPRHERATPPQVCADCGQPFRPHPTIGGSFCDDCLPF